MAHLTGFGLENFRVFEKETFFDLAPITVFTGTNNSGKSTVNKGLLLLAENSSPLFPSVNLKFKEDSHHNLGTQKAVRKNENKNYKISFSKLIGIKRRIYGLIRADQNNNFYKEFLFEYEYTNEDKYKDSRNSKIKSISIFDKSNNTGILKFDFSLDETNKSEDLLLSYYINYDYLIEMIKQNGLQLNYNPDESLISKDFYETIFNVKTTPGLYQDIKEFELNFLTKHFTSFGYRESYFVLDEYEHSITQEGNWSGNHSPDDYPLIESLVNYFKENGYALNEVDRNLDFNDILSDNFYFFFNDIYSRVIRKIFLEAKDSFNSIKYLNSIKTKPVRVSNLYNQEKTFYNSVLAFKDDTVEQYHKKIDFFKKWCIEFNIEPDISDVEGGSYTIRIKSGNETHNIADVGFGYAQLLALLMSFLDNENKIYILEEPETSLHPSLQSKLASLFVAASKELNIQFIIETHSEYLIRKLQHLTANGTITSDDTSIYYFYPPNNIPKGEKQVKKIRIFEDGRLSSDFGSGFFDESTRLMMDILMGDKMN